MHEFAERFDAGRGDPLRDDRQMFQADELGHGVQSGGGKRSGQLQSGEVFRLGGDFGGQGIARLGAAGVGLAQFFPVALIRARGRC